MNRHERRAAEWAANHPQRILSRREAADRAGFSISTLKRLEAAGLFPAKVKISAGRVGYLETEVDAWIAERVAERDVAA